MQKAIELNNLIIIIQINQSEIKKITNNTFNNYEISKTLTNYKTLFIGDY